MAITEKYSALQLLFEQQQQYINYYFNHFEREQAERCIDFCLQCQGVFILTGVGKSGIIAEKIAMTLISTGTRALYLPAMNFLHGDIGIISGDEVVIMLSKSGESEELLSLAPHIHRRGAKILACVSKRNSRLAQVADFSLYLPVEKELCPFDLAPTTSTVVQLLFGDVLAIALMRSKKFGLEKYALNHPSGNIGRKTSVLVKDLMLVDEALPLCAPQDRLIDRLVELSNKRCGCLLIVSTDQDLLGIFTDGDLRRALQAEGSAVLEKSMQELMTRSPITVEETCLALEAIQIMQENPKRFVMMLPVVKERKLIGLIHMHDIIRAGI